MRNLILFPFNGNAKEAASVVEDINTLTPTWNILGFIDDDPAKLGFKFGNYSVIGGKKTLKAVPDAYVLAVPGRPDNFLHRSEVINSLDIPPERFATILHPRSKVGIYCYVGYNTLLMDNVVLTANVSIGNSVVVLPNTVISHDSKIGEYCLIGSNVSVSGNVTIEKNCYIGSGAKIKNDLVIGCYTLIGLGSVVVKNTPSSVIIAGNPAGSLK